MSAARCTRSRSTAARSTSARTGSGRRSGGCSRWPTSSGVEVEKQYLDGTPPDHARRRAPHVHRADPAHVGLRHGRDGPRRGARRAPAAARAERRARGARAAPRGSTRSRSRTGCAALRSDEARAMWTLTARTVFGAEPSELSFLYFLWYAQCAGGVMQLTDFEGGAQDAHLARRHAAAVRAHRGRARRRRAARARPATAIKHDADGVSIKVGRRRIKACEGDRRGVARARRPDRVRPGAAGARGARRSGCRWAPT